MCSVVKVHYYSTSFIELLSCVTVSLEAQVEVVHDKKKLCHRWYDAENICTY